MLSVGHWTPQGALSTDCPYGLSPLRQGPVTDAPEVLQLRYSCKLKPRDPPEGRLTVRSLDAEAPMDQSVRRLPPAAVPRSH